MSEKPKTGYWLDLGVMPYEPAFAVQEKLFQGRMNGDIPTTVIVQENDPVFTIGRTGSRTNVLASDEELDRRNIQILNVNRGGDVTYHGPGQIIVSPLVYLGDIDLNANQFFHRLEDVLITVLAQYDIDAQKKEGYPGAWCGESKIGAVGIAVKHGYCFHGFSLNVNLDLTPFGFINPCGVQKMPVTSMSEILGLDIPPGEIRTVLKNIISEMFNFQFNDITVSEIEASVPERTANTSRK